jgi:hypothetical protein
MGMKAAAMIVFEPGSVSVHVVVVEFAVSLGFLSGQSQRRPMQNFGGTMGVGVKRATSTAPAVGALSAVLEVRPTERGRQAAPVTKPQMLAHPWGKGQQQGGSGMSMKPS